MPVRSADVLQGKAELPVFADAVGGAGGKVEARFLVAAVERDADAGVFHRGVLGGFALQIAGKAGFAEHGQLVVERIQRADAEFGGGGFGVHAIKILGGGNIDVFGVHLGVLQRELGFQRQRREHKGFVHAHAETVELARIFELVPAQRAIDADAVRRGIAVAEIQAVAFGFDGFLNAAETLFPAVVQAVGAGGDKVAAEGV